MLELFGGPDRDRTDDLFHAMEARSQLRHRPTLGGRQLFYFRRYGTIRQTWPTVASGEPDRAFPIPLTIISNPARKRDV
jgi:hypothetical protein